MRTWLKASLLFIVMFGWFAFFQPWGHADDPDFYTHAKFAELIAAHGPLQSFPWLDLTSIGQRFVDQHFLLHVLMIPFIKIFGLIFGAQIAAVAFAALFATVFYLCLHLLRVRYPLFWACMMTVSAPLIVRLSLGKASPLAIGWCILGLTALLGENWWLGAIAGFGFSLTHGGWPLLLLCQLGFLGADGLIEWGTTKNLLRSCKYFVTSRGFKVWLATFAACLLGVLVHPNSHNMWNFLWIQVVVIGIQTPFAHVVLGQEWKPVSFGEFFGNLHYFILLFAGEACVLSKGNTFEWPAELTPKRVRKGVALLVPILLLAGMTIKSRRYVEYFIPVLTLGFAYVDAFLTKERLRAAFRRWEDLRPHIRWASIIFASFLIFRAVTDLYSTWGALRLGVQPFQELKPAFAAISQVAQPGDRVFQPQWDVFPQLFLLDDRLRYISGMDPTYLYEANPSLSDEYTKYTLDEVTSSSQPYVFIHDTLHAKYVFFESSRNLNLEKYLNMDKRFKLLYSDDRFRSYQVL